MNDSRHITTTTKMPATAEGGWRVECSICGIVTEQRWLADAEVIAARHEEIQGFERQVG